MTLMISAPCALIIINNNDNNNILIIILIIIITITSDPVTSKPNPHGRLETGNDASCYTI